MKKVLFIILLSAGPAAFGQTPASTAGVLKLRYVTVLVKDYDSALHWYTKILGLKIVEEQTFGAGQRWSLWRRKAAANSASCWRFLIPTRGERTESEKRRTGFSRSAMDWIASAKQQPTKTARIQKAIVSLASGKKRLR